MECDNILKPLNDIAYCLECAAQDYTGELKTELLSLCHNIENKEPGYQMPEVQREYTMLNKALKNYRQGHTEDGATQLATISRNWWGLLLKQP